MLIQYTSAIYVLLVPALLQIIRLLCHEKNMFAVMIEYVLCMYVCMYIVQI